MFTGIIAYIARVKEILPAEGNLDIRLEGSFALELKIDQSVAHNGVCLTVVAIDGNTYTVTAVAETLKKTNLGQLKPGDSVNIELALRAGDRLDGHFVQGHVDATGVCELAQEAEGSWLYTFRYPDAFAPLVIEKGSICINGVSLTAFDVTRDTFTVTIIPYTYNHTTFQFLKQGDTVNLEFDILGKYMLRKLELDNEV
ncbi:MAG TPA: riboflavin synthase [Flavipsychrobacter sp.]